MANILPARPRHISMRRTFAIVASQYNAPYVRGLVEHATRELEMIVSGAHITRYDVPGAFEIPLAVQTVAEAGNVDAILALGVVIEGATFHAELIGKAVTHALIDISLRFRLPVIHEVLLVRDEEQARLRCLEADMNRGTEAARAAVQMVQTLGELKGR